MPALSAKDKQHIGVMRSTFGLVALDREGGKGGREREREREHAFLWDLKKKKKNCHICAQA